MQTTQVSQFDLPAVGLSEELPVIFLSQVFQPLFSDGEHAAVATDAIVEEIRSGLNLVGDRQEGQVWHEFSGFSRGSVHPSFFVVTIEFHATGKGPRCAPL